GSWTEPALTRVKKENTGASGRSQTITVKPFFSTLTVVRFSNDATSWASALAMNINVIKTREGILRKRRMRASFLLCDCMMRIQESKTRRSASSQISKLYYQRAQA